MSTADLASLGQRLREERIRRGMSLRGLAREVGVSASMISQIETGKSRPSVSTLYAITSALAMSIDQAFMPAQPEPDLASLTASVAVPVGTALACGQSDVDTRPAVDTLSPAGALAAFGMARLLGPHVRPTDRHVLQLDSGVTWERLGRLPGDPVDFILVTYAPGGTSSNDGGLMRHTGSEYVFVLRGELVLTLGQDESHLRADDAVSFDSTTPHRYRNDSTEPAVGVWFVIEGAPPASR